MTRWMNMWGMRFNIFSLPCSFLCGGAGYEPSCLFCVRVCVLKYLCVALVMCFGDAPVVNARLPLSLIPSHSLSLCSVSCVQIIFGDSSGFFATVSPPLHSFAFFPHLSVSAWKLHPLQRPFIFQDCLKIDCFPSSWQCTNIIVQLRHPSDLTLKTEGL